MIIWLVGMSGSGKTAIGRALYKKLKPESRHLVFIDGDDFREIFRNDADHTIEGRRLNAARISHFCKYLDGQGIHVIGAVLSIFPEWQIWNRENFKSYHQVFLDISLDRLIERDTKNLYSAGLMNELKNVVGLDIPFPTPVNNDQIIDEVMQAEGIDACVTSILSRLPRFD